MKEILLPSRVSKILNILTQAGYEAWAVGGCVRDSLLGRTPGDWDITTSALPGEIKSLFRRTVDTGIVHGTVTVMLGDEGYEVTTYRLDGSYSDGRHPDKVSFTASLEEDLKRRDFTVNAMAYHPDRGLVDLFGGAADLEAGIIRAVGDPMARFEEDALRIMRALRFSAQLGFSIEEKTFAAIRHFAPRLELVSRERIREEFMKLLLSPHPEMLLQLRDCGISRVIFPEWDEMLATPQNTPFHRYSVGLHTLKVVEAAAPTALQRLTALLHDVGKPACRTTDESGRDHFKGHALIGAEMTDRFLTEMKFDNRTREAVVRLVRVHDNRLKPEPEALRREINLVGEGLFPDYLAFLNADNMGKSDYAMAEFAPRYEKICALYREIRERGDCCFLKELKVTGGDLIAAGIRPGPELGRILNAMLEDVLSCPEHNDKTYLMERHCPRQ